MASITLSFVTRKINKVRFQPHSGDSFQRTNIFATGSWDDSDNKVCLWKHGDAPVENENGQEDAEPQQLCDLSHEGDVTALEFVQPEHLICCSSTGTVTLYRYHPNSQTLSVSHQWSAVHSLKTSSSASTCVATRGDDVVVTGGEDGRLNVLQLEHRQPIRVIDHADSCTINDVAFLKQSEVITANSTGQLKLFDIRQGGDEPSKTYVVSGEDCLPLQCLARHPGQQHIVATGGEDGMMCIWDLRQDRFPINPLEAHSSTVWELLFHPSQSDHLFSCSEDGTVWHWDASGVHTTTPSLLTSCLGGSTGSVVSLRTPGGSSSFLDIPTTPSHTTPWLSSNMTQNKLRVVEIISTHSLSVNSISIDDNVLVCGTDNEAIYTVWEPFAS